MLISLQNDYRFSLFNWLVVSLWLACTHAIPRPLSPETACVYRASGSGSVHPLYVIVPVLWGLRRTPHLPQRGKTTCIRACMWNCWFVYTSRTYHREARQHACEHACEIAGSCIQAARTKKTYKEKDQKRTKINHECTWFWTVTR